jgi:hypothetical protein
MADKKDYRTSHDVQRAHHLIAALSILKDHTAAAPLAASFARELQAMALKQMDLDAEEKAAEAKAKAAQAKEEEEVEEPLPVTENSNPFHAPPAPRR